ncbi:MAG: ABC transporter substrate-binding protein [Proteobacteria bacterium]|nr:ABC transporter substrate-binding protein [Pseudomonadota bacterium]
MRKLLLCVSSLILGLNLHADPQSTSKNFLDTLILFAEKQEKENLNDTALMEKLKSTIDWTAFVNRSLGKNKSKVKAADKKSFEKLLIELVELSAFPKAKQLLPFKNEVKLAPKGKNVLVSGRWFKEKDGDRVIREFQMDLFFGPNNKIVDATFETHSLSQNIAKQINQHLEKKPFSDLLEQMQKRVSTLKEKDSAKK